MKHSLFQKRRKELAPFAKKNGHGDLVVTRLEHESMMLLDEYAGPDRRRNKKDRREVEWIEDETPVI